MKCHMKYGQVIGCARCIANGSSAFVPSDFLFAQLGLVPPSGVCPDGGLDLCSAVKIRGESRSVLQFVRTKSERLIISINGTVAPGALGEDVVPPDLESLKMRPLPKVISNKSDGFNYVKELGHPFHYFEINVRGRSFADYRYGLTKELWHILTNQVENRVLMESLDDPNAFEKAWIEYCKRPKEEDATIHDWISRIPQGKGEDLCAETSCAFGAIETMIPWNLRFQLQQYHVIDDEPWTENEINNAAKAFVVPYAIIEKIVKQNPEYPGKFKSYLAVSTHVNEEYSTKVVFSWCDKKCRTP